MALRYGDRNQAQLFPPSIEDYVPDDAPVRAYDMMVEAMDLRDLGIDTDSDRVGNPRYDPKTMLKLLVYGYSYGVRSSRKLEREVNYNVSFMWLMGGLRPDFKTIAEFRRKNKKALAKALKQCARICLDIGLIAGNTLFGDGSKVRASASISNFWTESKCGRKLKALDERIEKIISDCEARDESEESVPSLVSMEKELKDTQVLKARVKDVLEKIKASGRERLNPVDPDCVRVKGRQGSHAGYNAQIVVDEKHGLIVSSDVLAKSNDEGEFSAQIGKANENLGKKCEAACADSGFSDAADLKKVEDDGIKVVVPSQRQAAKEKKERKGESDRDKFHKQEFRYDSDKDRYICPEGHELSCRGRNATKACRNYRIEDASLCRSCARRERCTKDDHGRSIQRYEDEEFKEHFEAEYAKPESQELYNLRKQKVELPFGHMKRNLGVSGFLLRGLSGVRAEMSLLATCFNVSRMITLLGGVVNFIRRLAGRTEVATT